MGQIVGTSAKIKRCNLNAIQSSGSLYSTVLASGEYMLVSTDNSMTATGNGNFDAYVVGDGTKTCGALTLIYIADKFPIEGSPNPVQSNGVYLAINGQKSNYVEGYYINSSGSVVEGADYCYCDYIPVANGDSVEWKFSNENKPIYIGVYNSSKSYVDYYSGNNAAASSGTRTVTISKSTAAYIRCSFELANINDCYVKVNGTIVYTPLESISGIKDWCDELENVNNELSSSIDSINTKLTIINETKTLTQSDGFLVSGYIVGETGLWNNGGSSILYSMMPNDIVYIKANSTQDTRYAFITHNFPVKDMQIGYEDGNSTYTFLEKGKEITIVSPTNCFLYLYNKNSSNTVFFPQSVILTREKQDKNFYDYTDYTNITVTPSQSDTYNAYYRTSQIDNFSFSEVAYKRLTYFPNYIVKGGEVITCVSTGINEIHVFELPFVPLNSSAINVFQNNAFIKESVFTSSPGTYTLRLNENTRRIAFVFGSTVNTTIVPSEITSHISSVTLPVADENSAIPVLHAPSFLDKSNLYYSGNKIVVSETPTQACGMVQRSNSNWGAIGTSCNYGKYSVGIAKGEGTMYIYNIETYSKLATWTGTSKDSTIWHANCATFVAQKYDNSDYFPLLYISVREGADPTNHPNQPSINVYRIVPTWTDGEISAFTATQVQTIWLPALTDDNGQGFPNVVYDKARNCLWAIGRQNSQNAPYYQQARLFKYTIPSSLNAEISISSISENWLLDASALYMQGAVVVGDYLFISKGYQSVGVIELYAINLLTHEVTNVIDLLSQGVTWEPEGTLYYNSHIWLQEANGKLYEFYL